MNGSVSSDLHHRTPLIDNSIYTPVTRWFLVPANVVVSLLGIVANTVNLIVFSKMTNKDTMSLSLSALALSDLLLAWFNLLANVINSFLFNGLTILFNVDLESLIAVGFSFSRPAFHKVSVMITTFVSFERALCVVKPFLVKRLFTKKRTIFIIVASYIVFITAFIPVNAAGRLTWQPIDKNNNSKLVLMASYSEQRYALENMVVLSVGLSFVWVTQIFILINAIVMAVGLQRSRRFRQSSGATGTEHLTRKTNDRKKRKTPDVDETDLNAGKNKSSNSDKDTSSASLSNSKTNILSTKEDRLMKTVLVLAILHISLNSPLSIYYISLPIVPELGAFKPYHNTFMLLIDFVNIPETLNGVFNILVYLNLNSKFKTIFRETFCNKRIYN